MSQHRFTLTDLLLISAIILSSTLLPWIAVSHAAEEKSKAEHPIYKPDVKGAPNRRVGGGTRGIYPQVPATEPPVIAVLAPEHTGYTTRSQPILYWAVSRKIDKPFMFTLVHADPMATGASTEPLLEVPIQESLAGIQAFDLAAHEVSLAPKVEYQWAITMVTDDNRQPSSRDIISTGTIIRVAPSEQLIGELIKAEEPQLPFIYAQEGFWYDAIDSLSQLIADHPEEESYKDHRVALLQQVGLAQFVITE